MDSSRTDSYGYAQDTELVWILFNDVLKVWTDMVNKIVDFEPGIVVVNMGSALHYTADTSGIISR